MGSQLSTCTVTARTDWKENRHRYVCRLGCTPAWTSLLLTSSCGQDCYEERAKQTLSGTPSDMMVKDLICLLSTSLFSTSFNLDEPTHFWDAFTE